MISLMFVFEMFVILFAVIGVIRGLTKEVLVSFSVILALTLTTLIEHYIPFVRDVMEKTSTNLFWLRSITLMVIVFFGYQSPGFMRSPQKAGRDKLRDSILGAFLGAVNGYLIIGTIWFYLSQANYPFAGMTIPEPPLSDIVNKIMLYMPPNLLGIPAIYFAMAVCFVFVIIVFI